MFLACVIAIFIFPLVHFENSLVPPFFATMLVRVSRF